MMCVEGCHSHMITKSFLFINDGENTEKHNVHKYILLFTIKYMGKATVE